MEKVHTGNRNMVLVESVIRGNIPRKIPVILAYLGNETAKMSTTIINISFFL